MEIKPMEFSFQVDPGGRELSAEQGAEFQREVPRIQRELQRRFGSVSCPEHGQPETLVTVLELSEFPHLKFSFLDLCCDAYNRLLLEAAKA